MSKRAVRPGEDGPPVAYKAQRTPSGPLLAWEKCTQGGPGAEYPAARAAVPGGWLVRSWAGHSGGGLAFVPDPEHRWASTG